MSFRGRTALALGQPCLVVVVVVPHWHWSVASPGRCHRHVAVLLCCRRYRVIVVAGDDGSRGGESGGGWHHAVRGDGGEGKWWGHSCSVLEVVIVLETGMVDISWSWDHVTPAQPTESAVGRHKNKIRSELTQ